MYQCKVCAYSEMPYPPADYNICPCCGVEYSVDDAFESHYELRDRWLSSGANWFSRRDPYIRPVNWSAWDQLDLAGFPYSVARPPSIVKDTVELAPLPPGMLSQVTSWPHCHRSDPKYA
jgi:hypothetical protein